MPRGERVVGRRDLGGVVVPAESVEREEATSPRRRPSRTASAGPWSRRRRGHGVHRRRGREARLRATASRAAPRSAGAPCWAGAVVRRLDLRADARAGGARRASRRPRAAGARAASQRLVGADPGAVGGRLRVRRARALGARRRADLSRADRGAAARRGRARVGGARRPAVARAGGGGCCSRSPGPTATGSPARAAAVAARGALVRDARGAAGRRHAARAGQARASSRWRSSTSGWCVSDLLQAPNDALNAAAPVAHLPQLQRAVFGSAVMGYGDLFVAALLGALLASQPRLGAARRAGRGWRWALPWTCSSSSSASCRRPSRSPSRC